MNLHPTRATFHVAMAGLTMLAVGVAARVPAMVGFGGAMLLAVAAGQAVARVTVTRMRSAGFEMVWNVPKRVLRMARGGELTMEAELRNRGRLAARAVQIRAVASSMLKVSVEPDQVDLPASSTARLVIRIHARRVGRWGLHGLALELRSTLGGSDALYEVPLTFANPFGVEVFPGPLFTMLASGRGGRSRRSAEAGRPASRAGHGDELRELREHVPGDPFKRIAWKASARRGQLVVREMERDERDVVWFIVDASVELWAGVEGKAPLDAGVDEIARLAARHLGRGDHVGLVVTASRLRSWIVPAGGGAQVSRLAAALTSAASMVDSDRSELDEREIGALVAEHARPLDARNLADLPRHNLDSLVPRARRLQASAPFAPRLPHGRTDRDRALRHYLAAFGIEVAPRAEGERLRTDMAIAEALEKLLHEKRRPSIVHVCSPAPELEGAIARAVRKLRARRVEVRWSLPPLEDSVSGRSTDLDSPLSVEDAVNDAVRARARAARIRGEFVLRKLGVVRARRPSAPAVDAPSVPTADIPDENRA